MIAKCWDHTGVLKIDEVYAVQNENDEGLQFSSQERTISSSLETAGRSLQSAPTSNVSNQDTLNPCRGKDEFTHTVTDSVLVASRVVF